MTNTSSTLRALIAYTAILPLALLIGYLLATPTDFSSVAFIGLVVSTMSIPLFLKFHRQLLFLTWNMTAVVFFLPGNPQMWVAAALISFFFVVLQRTMGKETDLLNARMVTVPLIVTFTIVVVTAMLTGGAGLKVLGSATFGGKAYIWISAAVLGYFALTSSKIPEQSAGKYLGLFFLGALSNSIGSLLTIFTGLLNVDISWLWYIFLVFPIDALPTMEQGMITRYNGLSIAALSGFYYLLARYGIRDALGRNRFVVMSLWFVALLLVLGGGYRAYFIPILLVGGLVFFMEGLVRSRYLITVVFSCILIIAAIVPFSTKLPLSIQRSLSVIPFIPVSEMAKFEARNSSEWRLEMWREMWDEVPRYLLLGKGIAIDRSELEMELTTQGRASMSQHETAVITGAYHNGPLTVLIPFGIWGLLAWSWFLIASLRALYLNYINGSDRLRRINRLLLALFWTKVIVYALIFGEFRTDFAPFVGLIAFSIALNGGILRRPRPQESIEPVEKPAEALQLVEKA